jgi:hypothetical protein
MCACNTVTSASSSNFRCSVDVSGLTDLSVGHIGSLVHCRFVSSLHSKPS